MLPRGKKPEPTALKLARGTLKPHRARPAIVPPIDGVPRPPAWLRGQARRIWDAKIAMFTRAGQSVVGCEGPLAIVCRLEADIVARWSRGEHVHAADLNCYRLYCGEFPRTPASQHSRSSPATPANPFAAHGRRPFGWTP